MRKDKTVFQHFKQLVGDTTIDEDKLSKIHLRIAEFSFRAYTKFKNNTEFNKIKALASDQTNVAFRTQVQTGGIKGEAEAKSDSSNQPAVSKTTLSNTLGVKAAKSKSKKRTQAEIIEDYKNNHYQTALNILRENQTDVTKLKNTTQIAAVMTFKWRTLNVGS